MVYSTWYLLVLWLGANPFLSLWVLVYTPVKWPGSSETNLGFSQIFWYNYLLSSIHCSCSFDLELMFLLATCLF